MAPIKTYKPGKNKSVVKDNPISNRKNTIKIKDLKITESIERAILSCDSLHVSTEDTFDKLLRSYREKQSEDPTNKYEKSVSNNEICEVMSNSELNKKPNLIYISTPNVFNRNEVVDNSISSSILSPISSKPFLKPRYTRHGVKEQFQQFENIKCKKFDSQSIIVIDDSEISGVISKELQNDSEKCSVNLSQMDVEKSKSEYTLSKDVFSSDVIRNESTQENMSLDKPKIVQSASNSLLIDLSSTNESISTRSKSKNAISTRKSEPTHLYFLRSSSKSSHIASSNSRSNSNKSSQDSSRSVSPHSYFLRSKSPSNFNESEKSSSNLMTSQNSSNSSNKYLQLNTNSVESTSSSTNPSKTINETDNMLRNKKEPVVNLTQNDFEKMLSLIELTKAKSNSKKLSSKASSSKSTSPSPINSVALCDEKDEESNKIGKDCSLFDANMKEAIVNLTLLDEKPLILKPGKQWRRSLVNQTRGANQRRRLANFTIINEGLDESLQVITISPESSIRVEDQEDFEAVFQRTVNLQDDDTKGSFNRNAEELGKEKGFKFGQERQSFIGYRKDLSAKEIVLKKCEQNEVLDFQECYPESSLKNCHKIAEGLYGEVFLLKKSPKEVSVLKVIPIEGSYLVNGEPQKKFAEVLSELTIQSELSSLRDDEKNQTETFSRLKKISCVRGQYPPRLIELWELFQETYGTENDHPNIFEKNQIFIVLELENAGRDLESFVFYNAKQSWSVFKQIVCGLAVAENSLEFEHRDLHWGNVLISFKEPKGCERYLYNGDEILVENKGVKATIIDYTMSRIKKNGICMFNDLKCDLDLFKGEGDYQFEIYRLMKKSNGDNWEMFDSYSNVLWLHYILGKLIKGVHYRSEKTRVHFNGINAMKELHKVLLNYKNVKELVNDVIKF
nr:uncharacterized protein LOC111413755 [Onthophagus taurus]